LNRRWTSFFAYAVALPNVDLCRRLLPAYRFYWLPLRLRLSSTTFFYDLLLRPVIVIIVIVIVHFLFKRNIYLSLLYVICVSFLEITFLFLLPIVQLKDVIFHCC
jgi:hypothetical protein